MRAAHTDSRREIWHTHSTSIRQSTSASKEIQSGTSLVVQWLRIHLAMKGTSVLPLVQEDPTSHGETKPTSSNYEPMRCNYWSLHAQEPVLHKTSHHSEKPAQRNKRVAPMLCNQRKPTCIDQTKGSQEKKSYHVDGTLIWCNENDTISVCLIAGGTTPGFNGPFGVGWEWGRTGTVGFFNLRQQLLLQSLLLLATLLLRIVVCA